MPERSNRPIGRNCCMVSTQQFTRAEYQPTALPPFPFVRGAVVVERERPCQSRSHKIQQPVSFAFGPSCNRAPFGSAAKRYSTGTPENSNTICTTVGLVKYPTGRFGAWCIALVHPRPRFCCFAAQRILHHLHRLVSTHVPFRPASSVLAGSAR